MILFFFCRYRISIDEFNGRCFFVIFNCKFDDVGDYICIVINFVGEINFIVVFFFVEGKIFLDF